METLVRIDFEDIGSYQDFYSKLSEQTELPEWFGNNLDAMYDWVTGIVDLPLHLVFVNMHPAQLESFEDLLQLLEEAEEETEDFYFSYFMTQYDDSDEATDF
jgi:ribonuclease inhibitor